MSTATITEKPILFSAPMILAILNGRKTVTRRIVKPQPEWFDDAWFWQHPRYDNGGGQRRYPDDVGRADYFHTQVISDSIKQAMTEAACPYRASERLWVRETFAQSVKAPKCQVAYRADGRCYGVGQDGDGGYMQIFHGWLVDSKARGDQLGDTFGRSLYQTWKPSIFMPRWASRITLEIVSVRIERLQEISEADAKAEGVGPGFVPAPHPQFSDLQTIRCVGYRPMFSRVWDEINGKTHPWASNPFVWRVEFRRIEE